MSAPRKYPEELRERAKRMVAEAREQDGSLSLHAAVNRIGPRVGVQPDTLRTSCRQGDVDAGKRAGVTTADAVKIKELEREVKELRRANEILLAASSFFARELDPATSLVVAFIAAHVDRVWVDGLRWGVQPICRVLTEHGGKIAPQHLLRVHHPGRRRRAASAMRRCWCRSAASSRPPGTVTGGTRCGGSCPRRGAWWPAARWSV